MNIFGKIFSRRAKTRITDPGDSQIVAADGTNTSIHETYVRPLIEENNWSGLVRYWMVNQYPPAMEAAIEVCRSQSKGGSDAWIVLTQFLNTVLQKPMFAVHQLPSGLPDPRSPEEQATLFLLEEWSKAVLCETVDRAPAHMREKSREVGLASALSCAGAARSINDTAAAALFLALAARAANKTKNFDLAFNTFSDALELYEELARNCPEIYLEEVGRTLAELGGIECNRGKRPEGVNYYERAIEIYSRPGVEERKSIQQCLGLALLNLAIAELSLNKRGDAVKHSRRGYEVVMKGFGPSHEQTIAAKRVFDNCSARAKAQVLPGLYATRQLQSPLPIQENMECPVCESPSSKELIQKLNTLMQDNPKVIVVCDDCGASTVWTVPQGES